MRLPSEYQEVEWIASSGTQYFIVGTSFKTSYKTVIDFQMTVIGGDYVPLGVLDNYGKRYGIDAWNSSFQIISGGSSRTSTVSEDTNRHTITIDKSLATVDGTNYSISYSDFTFTGGVGVFFYYNTHSDDRGCRASAKLYKLDIYDENGTQINDLVPCYRKSDTEIGMYDLINNQFYTNSGTGTFTKGADIKGYKIKKVYIGTITPEAWEPGSNTMAYFPMRGDFKDYSGGGYDLSITDGSYTLGNEYNTVTNIGGKNTSFTYSTSSSYTLSCWANLTSSANILFLGSDSASGRGMTVSAQQAACVVNNTQYSTTASTGKLNERCLYTAVFDYTNHKIIYYQNTEKIAEAITSSGGIRGGRWITLNKSSDYASANLNGKLGQMVCENVAWSDNDIADYYNRSRYNYEDMPKYIEIWPGEEPGPGPDPHSGNVDFTAVSLTDLTNAGWTYTNNTPGLDSGGFYCSNTSNDKYSSLWHPIDLTEANRIYIKAIINGSSGSWAGGPSFGIFKDTSSSYPYVNGCLSFTSQNGYNKQGMDINSSGTNNTYKINSAISGLYTLEVTVDFTTSKASYNLGGVYSTEVNIYPSDTFRQCAYIRCEAGHGIYNGVRIRSIEWNIT